MVFELYHELALQLGIDDATEKEYGSENDIDCSIIDLKAIVKDILHN